MTDKYIELRFSEFRGYLNAYLDINPPDRTKLLLELEALKNTVICGQIQCDLNFDHIIKKKQRNK